MLPGKLTVSQSKTQVYLLDTECLALFTRENSVFDTQSKISGYSNEEKN